MDSSNISSAVEFLLECFNTVTAVTLYDERAACVHIYSPDSRSGLGSKPPEPRAELERGINKSISLGMDALSYSGRA